MKVVWISNYKENSGYSSAAREYILSLDKVGVEVVPRSIKMINNHTEIDPRIKELENNDLRNVDKVIQFNLPHEFAYKGGIENIGIFAYETSGFPNTNWSDHLELMNKIIVCSNHQVEAIKNTRSSNLLKTFVLPYPTDSKKYLKDYELMDFETPKSTLKFYTIGENNRRKNMAGLIAAYYSAFSGIDDVLLVIKTNKTKEGLQPICDDLKRTMGRFVNPKDYPKIALIDDTLSEDKINSLHHSCDVFVTVSHGEAGCLPYIDALGFGKPCIVPKHSSFLDYNYDKGLLVDSNESVILGVSNSPKGLYTCDETWGNPSLIDMVNKLRDVYINRGKWINVSLVALRKRYIEDTFSREIIGTKLKGILNAKPPRVDFKNNK